MNYLIKYVIIQLRFSNYWISGETKKRCKVKIEETFGESK